MFVRFFFIALFVSLLAEPNRLNASLPASRQWEQRAWSDHLRSLIKQERHQLKQSVRAEIRQFKQKRKNGDEADVSQFVLTLFALILPPLAVYLHQGKINSKFWISLLLTLLIWVPGVLYALAVIFGIVP